MRGSRLACVTVVIWSWGLGGAALAQGLAVGADLLFYGDNTEFRNPFREGETIFGAAARIDGRVDISEAAALTLGVFGNVRFGSESAFEEVRPVIALTVTGRRSAFIFGTLRPPKAGSPAGPDRTGPHGLLPPLQRETLAFDRPYEAGVQWMFAGRRVEHDAWLHWQRLNTPRHRERLDAGVHSAWLARGPLVLPFQAHIVHEGGQLYASGPVRDSAAVASGIILSTAADRRSRFPGREHPAGGAAAPLPRQWGVSVELLGLWSRTAPDRQAPDRTRHGGAFFGRAAVEMRGWRTHLIAWRGDDFVKDEGDPNYLSIRRDGTRYRGVRDYAETGITRTFAVAPRTRIETSFRVHRIERHYEYSYRILAVAGARRRVR